MPENQYTTKEIADMLRVDPARIRQLAIASNGAIGRKWGRDWMFTESDLAALRERQTRRGPRTKPSSDPTAD